MTPFPGNVSRIILIKGMCCKVFCLRAKAIKMGKKLMTNVFQKHTAVVADIAFARKGSLLPVVCEHIDGNMLHHNASPVSNH